MEKEVMLAQVMGLEKFSTQYSRFGSDYVFMRVTSARRFPNLDTPMRVNGITMLLCISGSIDLDVNLTPYRILPNSMTIVGNGSILHVRDVDYDNIDAYVFVISSEFLRDINFDINIINSVRYTPDRAPVISLTSDEMALMRHYFDLIHFNTTDNTDAMYVRSISRCLIAAGVYQLMQFVRKHADESEPADQDRRPLSRRSSYVRDFMALVRNYHKQERSVAFYASKLYISPKYLSLIIKETTGRSAAQWIDEYVILEAKNLLRFSGKNIQQIAYELNFTNQSSFGKYFKHITGMSPTEFQKME